MDGVNPPDAFIDAITDHDVRITQLERASGKSKPSES